MTLIVKKEESLVRPTNKHQSWCFKNGYRIYPKAIAKGVYKIIVEKGDQKKEGEKSYSNKELTQAIWGLYKQIYDRCQELKADR